MTRWIRWIIAAAVGQGLILALLAWLVSGVTISSLGAALLAGLIVTLVTALLWPVGYAIAARLHPLLFPVLSFLVMGVVIGVADDIVNLFIEDGFVVADFWDAIILAIGLTISNTILGACFSVGDERAYERFVVRPLSLRYRRTPKSDVPGVFFLEIDGLSEPILRQAMDEGYAPNLKRWFDNGDHILRGWEPDLSSQTSASQAGILLGSNEGIPAFRWWDKERGQLMVSSKMATAETLEAQLASGIGLLEPDGGSRFNVFSGGAEDCVATFSRVGSTKGIGQFAYILYFTNPFTLFRTITMLISDVFRELWEARYQVRHDVQPRIHRHFKYAFIRAGTTVVMQEAARFMLIADMFRGVPSVYVTLFAYDEVAHHSGIDRPDALKVLKRLDQMIGSLEPIAKRAPRPYRFVVLSDHGQSMGATFLQRYDKTLGALVNELVADDVRVAAPVAADEALGQLNAALADAIQSDSRTARLARRALKGQVQDGELSIGTESEASDGIETAEARASDIVVLASGNLGLISFTKWTERMTYEQLTDNFPGLPSGLFKHPGISFILVNSEEEGGLILGPNGVRYLNDDHVAGEDPLADFGPHAADHLRRTNGFSTAPDILVISMFNPDTNEVAAFEELVGCHGGLGGFQTHPFVLYPSDLPLEPEREIIGAGDLNRVLRSWVRHLQPRNEVGESRAAAD